MQITVTSTRSNVYVRAHRAAKVEWTPRVQRLISSGVLAVLSISSVSVPIMLPSTTANSASSDVADIVHDGFVPALPSMYTLSSALPVDYPVEPENTENSDSQSLGEPAKSEVVVDTGAVSQQSSEVSGELKHLEGEVYDE